MEEKKLDINSIIGFVLIFGILLYMMYQNAPTEDEVKEQKAAQETVDSSEKSQDSLKGFNSDNIEKSLSEINTKNDSIAQIQLQSKYGDFAYAYQFPPKADTIMVETELFQLTFNTLGGYLSEVKLKKFVDYNDNPIYLIKDDNSNLNITFGDTSNRILNTKDLPFQSTITKNGENTIVSMKFKASEIKYLEYRYELKPNDYMIGFNIVSMGLEGIINTSQNINLDWSLKGYRHAKSISYENRYTDLHYTYEGDKDDYTGMRDQEESIEDVSWIGYKQHFFSSVLLTDTPFKTATIKTKNLVEDEAVDTVYTKFFESKIPLAFTNGQLQQQMDMYFGPSDFKVLDAYDRNLDKLVPFGWGIFGWINRYIFMPLFSFLGGFMPYGIAIVVMTILVKIVLSFVQYKQFLSQAKLKILKPELDAIREKYKNNKLKAQQETMALQSKAGASPLSGCLPGLMQIPVFYALFQFFPSAFDLRQQSFLWAKDLSSYDSILDLPFNIPFYGNHVSLFPILAAIAIFFYMKMTTGQNTAMQAPPQEGMPDMSKIMKYMIYFSPLLMLVFFNNYASGLSLYYFISNLISIGIMIVIKNYIIDEDKVLAKIEVSKSKPRKENRFQRKMKEMMEEAEKQKQAQNKRKK